jgi:hypothetical protein
VETYVPVARELGRTVLCHITASLRGPKSLNPLITATTPSITNTSVLTLRTFPGLFGSAHPAPSSLMSTSIHPKDEWRARQAISSDEFVTSNSIYRGLLEQIHQPSSSPAECAQFYVDHTVSLAANTDGRHDLDHFVEVFSGSILELGARTHYRDESIRFKLVEFVHELQKAVIQDPKSDSGEQLHYYDEPESVLWKDLPDYWLACAEERISFGEFS